MNYQKIYDQLIERSRTRIPPEGYIEHHHIIPRCMNGSDDKSNIAILTPEEHFVAHVLLVKIHPEVQMLILAIARMCKGEGRKKRKFYGWLKRRHAEYMKERMTGTNNPNYGKQLIWIHKGKTTKRIPYTEEIPIGWEKGIKQLEHSYCICCKKEITLGCKHCRKCMPKGHFPSALQIAKMQEGRRNWVKENNQQFVNQQVSNSRKQKKYIEKHMSQV